MLNFEFQSPTKFIFGRETENQVGSEIKKIASKVLLVHSGDDFIYESKLYDRIVKSLKDNLLEFWELTGVKPNPRLSLLYKGIEICCENNIDFILAVGGGSTIDTGKGIAVGNYYDGDVWDLYTEKATPEKALPVGVVVTIPAAGSEGSPGSVITNEDGGYKRGCVNDILRPKFAILNPELTFTLPKFMTSCGCADILSHIMERYFTNVKNVELTDRMSEAAMKTVINNSLILLKDPKNYDARAEIMWSAVIAHNDLLGTGREGDYASHWIGHELGGMFDVVHGASLSVITPAWMKYVYKQNINRFVQFASRVWNVDVNYEDLEETALMGIEKMVEFFEKIGVPTTISQLNINIKDGDYSELAEKSTGGNTIGGLKPLEKNDVIQILKLAK